MTLGFNFDMALHLPSTHSSSSSHHSHHDSVTAAAASIGIHHSHQLGQHHHHHNLGYSSYPIKYEPCEQQQQQSQSQQHLQTTTTTSSSSPTTNSSDSSTSSSSSSAAAAAGTTIGTPNGIGMIGAQDFLLHQQQQQQHISSGCSTASFDRDFFDTLDSSSSRMNQQSHHPQQNHPHLHQHPHQHHHHERMLSGGSGGTDIHPHNSRLSMDSPESDESDEDSESLMGGMNAIRNSMLSDDDFKQQQQQQHHLRALGKSSSLNSNNNNNNLDRKRPYPCKVCPSKFGSKMELEEHQNSHTGQKPFECEVCKSRFNRRSTLWNHKRIHSDAKPFVCTICSMQFKWKNSLKCHKEMHIRKNETPSIDIDSDIRQLTYATAAKRKMLEMDGCIGGGGESAAAAARSGSSSIFSAAPSTSSSSSSTSHHLNNNNNNGSSNNNNLSNESLPKNVQRKKQKLTKKESNNSIKKEPMDITTTTTIPFNAAAAAANNDAQQLNLLMNKAFGGHDFDANNCNSQNNYQGLMSNQAMRKLTFGNLGGDFIDTSHTNSSNNFGADFGLDHSNFDLMNNPLWMQFWNSEQVESMNQLDFHSNRNQNTSSLFGGMDDPSKVLANGIFDLKDTLGLHSPNGNANNNNNNAAAANHLNMLLPKPAMLNIDLNSFNSLHDSVNQRNHSNLPGINHLASATAFPDYSSTSSHDNNNTSLTSQFHLGQNQSTASSSSTPSSNGHQPNGHLNSELTYHQPLDHALLLNTNHSNDYMLPLEYMTPTGAHSTSIYPSHDLPLSALTSSHDPLEHSPHSSSSRAAAAMFYHSNLSDHHPGCISASQLPSAAVAAAVQQMR